MGKTAAAGRSPSGHAPAGPCLVLVSKYKNFISKYNNNDTQKILHFQGARWRGLGPIRREGDAGRSFQLGGREGGR